MKVLAVLLVVLASSACDSTTVLQTTAKKTHAVEFSCALKVAEAEFRGEDVRGEPKANRIAVVFAPDGVIILAPTLPDKGEFSAKSFWFGRPKSEPLVRMEGLQRRAIKAILARCGQPGPLTLYCSSSRGPVSGDTCFGPLHEGRHP